MTQKQYNRKYDFLQNTCADIQCAQCPYYQPELKANHCTHPDKPKTHTKGVWNELRAVELR